MDNIYNNSPYYTLANYYNYTLPEDYISPNSAAAQLGLTPADMAPILQEQQGPPIIGEEPRWQSEQILRKF